MSGKTHKHEQTACDSKSRFKAEHEAKESARRASKKHSDRRARPYFCPACKGWHLTTIKR